MKKQFYLLLAVFFLSACEKFGTPRTYVEITDESDQPSDESMDPHAGFSKDQLAQMLSEANRQNSNEGSVTWTVPEGWDEIAGSGMRIASFVNQTDPGAMDCSIVSLGKEAGGLAPNVTRWLGQLSIPVPPEAEIKNFIDTSEKISLSKGMTALVFDFTLLQKETADTAPSMLAAIIDTPGERIFVKMTGTKQNVLNQSKAFKSLVKSLTF